MNPHFASLIVGLTTQAESALKGELPPGAEDTPNADPKLFAQALIDTLAALEEKTRGNLEPDEKQLLDQALTTLRFRFVSGGSP